MFCTKCGENLSGNVNFCTKCGAKIENSSDEAKKGTITFVRESQFYGVLVPIHVYLDGLKVASLSAGGEQKVESTIGKHGVALDLWSGNGEKQIELTEEYPNIRVVIKLKTGLITSKPTIVRIEAV